MTPFEESIVDRLESVLDSFGDWLDNHETLFFRICLVLVVGTLGSIAVLVGILLGSLL